MMRILIVKSSSMGDVIHNLPIVNDILKHYPDAMIDWVVEDSFAEILSLHPNINRVITVALRRWKKNLFSRQTRAEIKQSIQQLKQTPYDYIIDTQGLLKSILICAFAKGEKHGRDWETNREKAASLFYQHCHHVPYEQHTLNRNRQLAALALGYSVPTSLPEYGLPNHTLAKSVDANLGLPNNFIIALHGTSRESKLWPVSLWIALGNLLNKLGFTIVLPWSSQVEFERANKIATNLQDAIVLPKLGLSQLASICAAAKAAIGVDTGLVHLAVAVKTPSIAIYTDTEPALNGAYAGNGSLAINLGGVANTPSPIQVMEAFTSLNVTATS